jgi:hypothetical protein
MEETMRMRTVAYLAFLAVGCGADREWYLESSGSDSDRPRPELNPLEPVPEHSRKVTYSLMYEEAHRTAPGMPSGPMSVALTYQGNEPFSFRGFCVDVHDFIDDKLVYRGKLYSSFELIPDSSALVHPENLELANYLLTRRFAGSSFESPAAPTFEITSEHLQGALWTLVSSDAPADLVDAYGRNEIEALVADARTHGQGFVPKPGEHAAMIIVAEANVDGTDGNDVQTLAIDVSVPGDITCGDDFVEPCHPRDVPDPPADPNPEQDPPH